MPDSWTANSRSPRRGSTGGRLNGATRLPVVAGRSAACHAGTVLTGCAAETAAFAECAARHGVAAAHRYRRRRRIDGGRHGRDVSRLRGEWRDGTRSVHAAVVCRTVRLDRAVVHQRISGVLLAAERRRLPAWG